MFIINKDVSFNEEDGNLENQVAEVSVLMAASTRRLLEVLIKNQGNPVTRDCLFKTVWDDNGMRSSNGNLNQYISILRKQLDQVGLPDNTIITIPRVGFMFNPDILISQEISVTAVPFHRVNGMLRPIISGSRYCLVFAVSFILFFVVVSVFYFYTRGAGLITLDKLAGYPAKCHVYALPGEGGVNKMEPVKFISENCGSGTEYFIFMPPPPSRERLVVSCEISFPGYFINCHNRLDVKE